MMRRLIFSRVLVIGLLLTVVFGGGAYVAHALERDNDDGSGHSLFVGEYDSVVGTRQRVGGNRVRVDNGPIQGNGPLHHDRRLGAHVYRCRC